MSAKRPTASRPNTARMIRGSAVEPGRRRGLVPRVPRRVAGRPLGDGGRRVIGRQGSTDARAASAGRRLAAEHRFVYSGPDARENARPRRPRMARHDRPQHRSRRAACRDGGRPRDLLRRFRPDRAEPPFRQPGAAGDHAPAPAGGAYADRPRRRRDRPRRRPERSHHRAHPERPRGDRRLGRADQVPGRALPRLRRAQRGRDRQQPRLDREDVGNRLAPRHREALQRQPHAGKGVRQRAPRGRRHQLHGVQLPGHAGGRLPRAVSAPRLHPAARRQ